MHSLQNHNSAQPSPQPSTDASSLSASMQQSHAAQLNNAAMTPQQQQAALLSQQQLIQRIMAPPHMSMIPSSFYSPQAANTSLMQGNPATNAYIQSPQQQFNYLGNMNGLNNNNTLSMNVMMPSTPPMDYNLLQQQQQQLAAMNNGSVPMYGNNPLMFNQSNMMNFNAINNMQQSNPSMQSNTQPNSNTSTPGKGNVEMQKHLQLLQQLTNGSAGTQQSQVNRQVSGQTSAQQSLMPMNLLNNGTAPQPMFGTQSLYNPYNMAALQRTASNTASMNNNATQPMNLNQIISSPNWHTSSQMFMQDNQSRATNMSPIADSTAALAQAMQARAESLARMHGTSTLNYNNNNSSTLASDAEYGEDTATDPEENRVITAGGRKMKTGMQSKILKAFYTKQQRPSKDDVQALVNLSGLPYHEISRWFRNERHKDKKSREAKSAALTAMNRPPSATTVCTASPQIKPAKKIKSKCSVQNTPMSSAMPTRDEIEAQNILIQGISDAAQLATQAGTEYKRDSADELSDSDDESHSSDDSVDADQSSPDNGDKPMQQTEINTVDTLSAQHLSHQQATNAENVRNGNDSPIKPPDSADNLSVADIDNLHGTTSPADKQFQLQPTAVDAWNYLNKLFVHSSGQKSSKRKRDSMIDEDMLSGLVALFKPHRVYLKRICDQLLPNSPVTNLI